MNSYFKGKKRTKKSKCLSTVIRTRTLKCVRLTIFENSYEMKRKVLKDTKYSSIDRSLNLEIHCKDTVCFVNLRKIGFMEILNLRLKNVQND